MPYSQRQQQFIYSLGVGGICSPNRYTIAELRGINLNIANTAHELGHM